VRESKGHGKRSCLPARGPNQRHRSADEDTLVRAPDAVLGTQSFDANAFLADVHRIGAMLLARARSQRNPLVLQRLPDGSYRSHLDGLTVRIIEVGRARRGLHPGPRPLPALHHPSRPPPLPDGDWRRESEDEVAEEYVSKD
jgi:hypothetical protein